jgi:hypothetical protein
MEPRIHEFRPAQSSSGTQRQRLKNEIMGLLLGMSERLSTTTVLDAYGWPHDLSDDAMLERLLRLNAERAAMSQSAKGATSHAD